jgi:deoxyadenosine/deoxycytidine kinase
MKKTIMISVEGNIGAGKSFLCRMLQGAGMSVSPEPVSDWILGSNNVLESFYTNPKKYASMFQTLVLRSRVEQMRGTPTIVERCVHSDKLFATMHRALGNMDDVEYAAYMYQYQQAVRDTPSVAKYIYVRTPAHLCLERIKERSRSEEQAVQSWYIYALQVAHDNWMEKQTNVLTLNGAEDWTDAKLGEQVVERVKSFVS